jgi:hypothetical protein
VLALFFAHNERGGFSQQTTRLLKSAYDRESHCNCSDH